MLSKPPLMNFNSFLVILFLNLTSFTYANVAQDNSKFIENLVSAFDNKSIFNNWLKSRKHKEIVDTVKEIVVTVKDILIVINKQDYVDLKNMIIEGGKLLIDETENLYYETRIILKSIARIIRIHYTYIDEHYSTKGLFEEKNKCEADLEDLIDKIVLNEYENIYYFLNRKIRKNINSKLGVNDMQFNEKISKKNPVNEFDKKFFDYIKFPIDASRKMIDNIIKLDNTRHTFILAYKGISFSHKCSLNEKNNHLSFDYLLLSKDSNFKNLESINLKHNKEIENFMKLHMFKKLAYNEIALKLFISLIYLFTKISGQDTKYEIYHNTKRLYEIEWSYGRSFWKKLFKKYYLQKNISFSSTIKNKISSISYLENNSTGHSITFAKKIKARSNRIRLLLLSCGHQLGLKLWDYFFEKCYDMKFGRTNCPICDLIITIIGSQEVFYDQLKRIKT